MTNFNIIDGDNYWNKYEQYIELYNNREIRVNDIIKKLGITRNKMNQYKKRAVDENRIKERYLN